MTRTTSAKPPDNVAGIGQPPPHLPEELAATWSELALHVAPDAAGQADRCSFELLTRLVARMRRDDLAAAETAQLRGLLDQFGLSPDGRRRAEWAKLVPRINSR